MKNCSFCNNPIVDLTSGDPNTFSIHFADHEKKKQSSYLIGNYGNWLIYCQKCDAITYGSDDEIHKLQFFLEINGRGYDVDIDYIENRTNIFEIKDDYVNNPPILIVDISTALNVSQHNAFDKIRTILTFL